MAEHKTFTLEPLKVVDWRAYEHYTRLHPDGAIYAVTGRGQIFVVSGRSDYEIRLEMYGGTITFWRTKISPGRTPLGGFGVVVKIVSANRQVLSPEDIKAILGHALSKYEQPS